jgi:hypothetical protein
MHASSNQELFGVDAEIDLPTTVDVAVRDLREIPMCWGSEVARQRT